MFLTAAMCRVLHKVHSVNYHLILIATPESQDRCYSRGGNTEHDAIRSETGLANRTARVVVSDPAPSPRDLAAFPRS